MKMCTTVVPQKVILIIHLYIHTNKIVLHITNKTTTTKMNKNNNKEPI
jgi:hypothetical protein